MIFFLKTFEFFWKLLNFFFFENFRIFWKTFESFGKLLIFVWKTIEFFGKFLNFFGKLLNFLEFFWKTFEFFGKLLNFFGKLLNFLENFWIFGKFLEFFFLHYPKFKPTRLGRRHLGLRKGVTKMESLDVSRALILTSDGLLSILSIDSVQIINGKQSGQELQKWFQDILNDFWKFLKKLLLNNLL